MNVLTLSYLNSHTNQCELEVSVVYYYNGESAMWTQRNLLRWKISEIEKFSKYWQSQN